ncbi:MAG: lytic transglycosylase domain-containing protein [Pseudomonadota bacterium]|nr:lytic transglycosylase domain-containing protein [Pseudomonadota bacterium]
MSAKENPPEPLQNPGECPIDLPVRVASLESLRHFEGLIGHCPETSVIESPALEANRPRATIKAEDGPPAWQIPPQRGPRETDFKSPDKKDARTRMIASRDGSQVAIRPGSSAWQSGSQLASVSDSAAPAQASAGSEEDAEAVLALRPRSYTTVFDQTISTAARTHQVDPLLLHAVIKQESGYRPQATSHAGARGLMQVMPGTGRMLGVRDAGKLYDPGTNVDAGAKLLSQLWQRFDGNLDLVLAAYNAGEGAVRKYGNTVPPYRETRDYVVKVKANYRKLAAESGLAVDF